MCRWSLVWLLFATASVVGATFDSPHITQTRSYISPQVNCVDYKMPVTAKLSSGTMYKAEMHPQRYIASNMLLPLQGDPKMFSPVISLQEISRRFDSLFPEGDDIVKEHAKLVQDINSLRQAVFVAPFPDENRDYDDTIFQEIIETSTTPRPTTPRATTPRVVRPTRSSFPVLLLGGASQRQPVRNSVMRLPKPTISLVGTSVSPLSKHPYPFASSSSLIARKPVKICVTSMPMPMYTTTRRPSLWERILSSIIPR